MPTLDGTPWGYYATRLEMPFWGSTCAERWDDGHLAVDDRLRRLWPGAIG